MTLLYRVAHFLFRLSAAFCLEVNKSRFVIPVQAGIRYFASIRFADSLLDPLQSTGHRPSPV